jgi:hypothetical protein
LKLARENTEKFPENEWWEAQRERGLWSEGKEGAMWKVFCVFLFSFRAEHRIGEILRLGR